MTDTGRKLHGDSYQEWKEQEADEYARNQRDAFMAGFEAAAYEAENWRHLRDWLEEKRDDAREREQERDDVHGKMAFAVYNTYVQVLVKLAQMGCRPRDTDE